MLEKPLGFRLGNQVGIQADVITYTPPPIQTTAVFPKSPVSITTTVPTSGGSGGSFNAGTGGVS
jgi:hypothetical protein